MTFKLWIKTLLELGTNNPTGDTIELDLWITELSFVEYSFIIDLLCDY